MTLKQYLAMPNVTGVALAHRMGVSTATISRWASGQAQPDVKALRALHAATDWSVTPNDFLEK